jgi:3-isopropylmalate dehydrogenase
MKIAVLPGDGIGKEIVSETLKVLGRLALKFDFEEAPVGGAGYEAAGHPLPPATLALAKKADAILFGSVGDPKYDNLESSKRPEQAILGLRKELGLFANLRPAQVYAELADASSLRPEVVAGLDILIVRELTGDIYFGQPKGIRQHESGGREGFDTMRYTEAEIRRIARVAFDAAQRGRKSVRWTRQTCWNFAAVARSGRGGGEGIRTSPRTCTWTTARCSWCATQAVRRRHRQYVRRHPSGEDLRADRLVGMLPSASLDANGGLYEPIHGSAPDIAARASPIRWRPFSRRR